MPNGLGPAWFPEDWRTWLTQNVWFMEQASWVKHDEGYARGDPPRLVCDLTFLTMMVRDSYRQFGWRFWTALALSWAFYALVRVFGWISYGRKTP